MPHLLKIRLDGADNDFFSMRDAGPLVGEMTAWGTFGENEQYRTAGDVRYVRDGNLRVGDRVVVRERQIAKEVFIVAILEVVGLETSAGGGCTPNYRVIERFDGSQPLAQLMIDSPRLATLPHFQKDAKGMMLRAITELSDDEFDLVVEAARASHRNGLRPLFPTFEPGEPFEFTFGDETLSFVADDEGYMPIEFIDRVQSHGEEGYVAATITEGQIPVPSVAACNRLARQLSELLRAGEKGRQKLVDAWRNDCDDEDLQLYLMRRSYRPASGIAIKQFTICGAVFVSESQIMLYPAGVDGGYLASEGAMSGFLRAGDLIPIAQDEYLDFATPLAEALNLWVGGASDKID
jgi:hypothetical protein